MKSHYIRLTCCQNAQETKITYHSAYKVGLTAANGRDW